jgi:hypothetical protein
MRNDCSQTERLFNAWLDARAETPPADVRALVAHAASCPACRAIAARYELLGRALRSWGPGPSPPEGFADRVIAAAHPEPRVLPVSRWRWAAAAAVVVATLVGLRGVIQPRSPERKPIPVTQVVRPEVPPRPLSDALADATQATLALARETSAPAARIGRQVLAAATINHSRPLALQPSIEPAADVLQSVGDGVNQGVRPLSGSARHAFRFLIGPALQARPTAARGRGA